MPNSLTGDFEAVLQVSASTVNRLLATLHQNAFTDPALPSFPHLVRIRIGDDHPIDGVRGLVHGQVGVPRVELIHGATDRFWLEVGVRAWYRPDAGTTSLPAYINGTVRAAYHFEPIDPGCFGWAKIATQYLWVRVIQDSVTFQGTTADDPSAIEDAFSLSGAAAAAAAEAANIAKVQKQVAGLLARRFEATPHPVKPGFRRDLMRSLNVPLAGSAVAVALGLSPGDPAGSISTVEHPFLEDADIGLAINIGFLFGLAQPMLDEVAKFALTVPIHVDLPLKDFDTVYRVSVDPPSLTWEPNGWFGLMKVKVHGRAETNSIAANATFDVDQHLMLQFDAGRGTLVASAASPVVKVHAAGLYAGTVAERTKNAVFAAVEASARGAVGKIQPMLDRIPDRTVPLVTQLATLDKQAAVGFTEGVFLRDGIIIKGFVSLAPRHAPVVSHDLLAAQDGHTALESWVPGGRIDRFDWSWTWTVSSIPGGKATFQDRFLLRRPRVRNSRWGVGLGPETPLPGLDGWGRLCLTMRGVQVDAVTGAFVPVESSRTCRRFGLNISDRVREKDRLYLRDMPELSRDVPFPQLSLVRVGDAHIDSAAANTLVVFAGDRWHAESASAVREGLERCGRYDAGLTLLILFQDGVLERRGTRLVAEVEELARDIGIAAMVNEDVHGGWSRALGMADVRGGGWVLLSPQGAVTWRHEGRLPGEVLTKALDTYLHRSVDAAPAAVRAGLDIGSVISGSVFHPGISEHVESHCPPLPLGRGVGSKETVVTFVARSAGASQAHLRQLYADYGQRGDAALVVVVVDGANTREAEALRNELGVDFVTVPDPLGAIADQLGVGTWPTTVKVDETGTVFDIATGVRPPDSEPTHCKTAE